MSIPASDNAPMRKQRCLTEANVDQVIDYARAAGRRQILTYVGSWSSGAGHYAISPTNYPEGEASLKRVADKLHNAGMKLGIHINTPAPPC